MSDVNTKYLPISNLIIYRSNIRGFLLPALGLSDWKHSGVVELYSKIADQGYTMVYLTNRAIGQSDMTREYIYSLTENQYKMPEGPIREFSQDQVVDEDLLTVANFSAAS